jgi:hypothetical protein
VAILEQIELKTEKSPSGYSLTGQVAVRFWTFYFPDGIFVLTQSQMSLKGFLKNSMAFYSLFRGCTGKPAV